ncbi:Gfo/Idh/MocA family oxidoreductase [bacterium]|nr:Gfo/Idh/MocA family oxidoreductase [bacterium]
MTHFDSSKVNRRDFLAASTGFSAAVLAAGASAASKKKETRPKNLDLIKVGLVGAGGRGTGAAIDCIVSSPNIELVAVGDLFKDRIEGSLKRLREHKEAGKAVKVTPDTTFTGFDAYKHVLACDIDLVILATPPGFRPTHFDAAIKAGKHVFMEKPVAVDPVGVRVMLAASQLADEKKLCVVAGTQRRHQQSYLEMMKRIEDGAIGEIVGGQCYWNQGGLWVVEQKPGMSDMEWQCRNWLYFAWLSGDHIVEQHVHNIDVVNWAIGAHPVSAVGMGGRQARVEPKYGHIYDHFTIEYEYPGGVRVTSMCRQMAGCSNRIGEHLVGTRGVADFLEPGKRTITARRSYKFEGDEPNPYVTEHADLIDAIRSGRHINEARRVTESTMTAIMGRISAYTGRQISWDWVMNKSQLDLSPKKLEFGALEVPPVPVPGQTQLV